MKFPKPWFRSGRGWYVTLDGQQINLGTDRKNAFKEYKSLLNEKRPNGSVVVLIDSYLEWCEKHRAPDTYRWYKDRLQDFAQTIPSLLIDNMKPYHVQEWVDSKVWADGSKRNGIAAIKRVFTWAEEQGHIIRSPIAHLKKPKCGKKELVITREQYHTILKKSRDQQFRDLITTHWETGCRPQESLRVEARHLDLANQRWVIQTTPGKPDNRVVYLTDTVLEICQRLAEINPIGPLFRN